MTSKVLKKIGIAAFVGLMVGMFFVYWLRPLNRAAVLLVLFISVGIVEAVVASLGWFAATFKRLIKNRRDDR